MKSLFSHRKSSLFLMALLLTAPFSTHADIVAFRAIGEVTSIIGSAALFPLPVSVGDPFTIDFKYDSAATDDIPSSATLGSYAILEMVVTAGANSVTFFGPGIGDGHIGIQTDPAPNLWGVSSCLGICSSTGGDPLDLDEARMNLFFPAGFISSDALTLPPSPVDAETAQFGLFSLTGEDEAFVIASLATLAPVPVPAAAWLFGSGLLGLIGCARRGRTRAQ